MGVVNFSVFVRGGLRVAYRLSALRIVFRGRTFIGHFVPRQYPPFLVFFHVRYVRRNALYFVRVGEGRSQVGAFQAGVLRQPNEEV